MCGLKPCRLTWQSFKAGGESDCYQVDLLRGVPRSSFRRLYYFVSQSQRGCSLPSKSTSCCFGTGREIPSFCIFAISVVRLRPSLAAAPLGPPITQPAVSSVCRMRLRSESLRVVRGGEETPPRGLSGSEGIGRTPSIGKIKNAASWFFSTRQF